MSYVNSVAVVWPGYVFFAFDPMYFGEKPLLETFELNFTILDVKFFSVKINSTKNAKNFAVVSKTLNLV